jgi:hypothetical protein
MARPESTRLKIEDCAALHVSQVPDLNRPGYRLTEAERWISGTVHGTVPFQFNVRLYRGSRGWVFVCPACERAARSLYLTPNSDQLGCRVCLQLVYDRQYWTSDMRIAHSWFFWSKWKAEQDALRRSLATKEKRVETAE